MVDPVVTVDGRTHCRFALIATALSGAGRHVPPVCMDDIMARNALFQSEPQQQQVTLHPSTGSMKLQCMGTSQPSVQCDGLRLCPRHMNASCSDLKARWHDLDDPTHCYCWQACCAMMVIHDLCSSEGVLHVCFRGHQSALHAAFIKQLYIVQAVLW